MTTQVKIKLVEGGELPKKMTEGAAAYDCYARTAELLDHHGEVVDFLNEDFKQIKFYLGFCLEIPVGYKAKIIARSSIHKKELRLSNGIGLIDCDYRGEVSAVFDITDITDEDYSYGLGDRVCQMFIERDEPTELAVVDELSETKRGTGGYGHTGK